MELSGSYNYQDGWSAEHYSHEGLPMLHLSISRSIYLRNQELCLKMFNFKKMKKKNSINNNPNFIVIDNNFFFGIIIFGFVCLI